MTDDRCPKCGATLGSDGRCASSFAVVYTVDGSDLTLSPTSAPLLCRDVDYKWSSEPPSPVMRDILDAARAARRDARGDAPRLRRALKVFRSQMKTKMPSGQAKQHCKACRRPHGQCACPPWRR